VVPAEHGIVDGHQRTDPGLVVDEPQLDARWRWRVQVDLGEVGHEHGLGRVRHEPGRSQPVGEVTGGVVGVELPLPRAGEGREPGDLGGDDLVGAAGVEVGPQHAGPPVDGRDGPGHAVVPLDRLAGQTGRGVAPDLLIEGGEDGVAVHHRGPDVSRRCRRW
jgi:hypothetical protein